jgi:hypothetical protein
MKKSILSKVMQLYVIVFLFTGCGPANKVEFIEGDNQIDIMVDDRAIGTYKYDPDLSKPFIYPVYSPSGEVVTRWAPFRQVEGESNDHLHHTGIFFTYGNGEVNGNTFWGNRDVPPRTGDSKYPQIRQVELKEMKGGRGHGHIKALYHWVDSANIPLLEEDRLMEFHASENHYTIDFTMHLSALDRTVTFEDTKEGMFAIRVADWLGEGNPRSDIEGTGEYLNAEGDKTEKGVWGKRSSWVRLEGEKDGKTIGIAIFHHPQSVNYPTYWHARGYGCFAVNPLGQYDFQRGRKMENPQHRTYTLEPGETGLFKFRMLIYEGEMTKEQFDQEFEEFSKT